ncbi:TnsA endonuclease N-terminal domain-containing protein [Vibrio europaeus]|uniref:TnsA endonuclease N-terminal domain-containing protein n=1 Tax=Vibrio europaeus TaxID=300876 RepID=UPI00233ED475|nr:TnsA endonuclease N-terminal domain-containing protein [Vibrio europaeus]MDC5718203.1 TnsA endonuclease N-terminal domain-containing protein [Vibrio europaeus]MDC5753689.1 TnsA endonuclease N-terminal domain-containing protein [Vibrio europaeus]MDC5778398.1 TnsA endonuclease N-terminal domain-containing protein [Vibrio europaeus]MDC5793563.1 TnsA endonuclease N-terminal domain-containing protein [Vibrio europaeus]MDC5798869.1 TnsA endonuclease N-terminal domain-containing protein [Vibrio eu
MGRGRKLESFKDFERALKNKYGIGQGFNYKPWLRIQDVKSTGTRSLIYGRKSQRDHHMMSSIESEHFYLAEFSNSVIDIREQFPLLPLNYTQKIAKTLGVEHPKHPQSKEPIIMTTDQLLTIDSPQGTIYHAISVKPEDDSGDLRVLEKIDIERVCWELLGVKFSYFTGNELTRLQSSNLHWATSPFRENPIDFSCEQVSCALSALAVGQYFIEDLCNQLISMNVTSHDDALLLVRFLIADKFIDVDLSTNIPESGLIDVKYVAKHQGGIIYGAS